MPRTALLLNPAVPSHGRLVAVVLLGAALSAAGCPDEGDEDAGEAVAADSGQAGDGGAGDGDADSGTPECTQNTDCGMGVGRICEEGSCVDGCTVAADCPEFRICFEGRCVGCTGDADCVLGFRCESDVCIEGCLDDDRCPPENICTGGACVEGCRNDDGCTAGEICEDLTCIEGCRIDDDCGADQICEDLTCMLGCRGTGDCAVGEVCFELACETAGTYCLDNDDCDGGQGCPDGGGLCEVGPSCSPDAMEPNDATPAALELSPAAPAPLRQADVQQLTLCAGDVDRMTFDVPADGGVSVVMVTATAGGAPTISLSLDGLAVVADEATTEADSVTAMWNVLAAGTYELALTGASAVTENLYALQVAVTEPEVCTEQLSYLDQDDDGFGDPASQLSGCLEDGIPDGYAASQNDCGPNDALRYPGSPGVCNDNVDDDCDDSDEECPTTQPGVMKPNWNCVGPPPSNVVAYATFASGQGYFVDGGCFVFYEGALGEFFVSHTLVGLNQDPSCETLNGCVCPSLNGWPSYDRRLYAFTTDPAATDCEEIALRDHAGQQQVVSNDCRKYLFQMHWYQLENNFIGFDVEEVRDRLALLPQVEVACAQVLPHQLLPYETLLTADIVLNQGYVPMGN